MLKKILLAILVALIAFAIIAAFQPADFRFARSATISAPPATVFEYCNDLHKWQEWSPWAKLDPDCKITYEGMATGLGSSYSWSGNGQVGEGKMSIIDVKPNELVRNKLEFKKPFEATNTVDFTLKPAGDKTELTWSMYGTNGYMGKLFGMILNMDKMCDEQFNQGFANLESVVKAKGPAPAPAPAAP